MFHLNDALIAVFRLEGEIFALDNRCPHAGASLAHGFIEGDSVRCRIHHWRFCIRDGRYLDEDNAKFNARTFRVRVVGRDVQVETSD